MRKLTVVTPGHPQPLDALIAWGLALAVLDTDPEAEVCIAKAGRYFLTLETDLQGSDLLDTMETSFEVDYEEKLSLMLDPQPGLSSSKIKDLVSLARSLRFDPLLDYQRADHAVERGEGRGRKDGGGKKRGASTSYLQVAPWAGKYALASYSAEEDIYYLVCPLCSALAWYGAVRAASVISTRRKNEVSVVYSLPDLPLDDERSKYLLCEAPTPSQHNEILSFTTADLLLLSQVFGEKYDVYDVDVPTLAAPLLTLASGETIYPLAGRPLDIYVWKHARERQAIALRSFTKLPGDRLMSFVSEAKARNVPLARIVSILVRERRPELIADIVSCLLYDSPDEYSVVRSLWSLFEEYKLLSEGLIEALYKAA